MYVENVRKAINSLEKVEYDTYLIRLRNILHDQYNKNVKPSEIRSRVDEFKNGKDPKIDYFEAYLKTFDTFRLDGSIQALKNEDANVLKPWEQLILNLPNSWQPSEELTSHLLDDEVSKEAGMLLRNVLNHCSASNKENFIENLHLFNRFLGIR